MSDSCRVMHLTSSRFFGGPERQMLGLACALRGRVETSFASFDEEGLNRDFLKRVRDADFEGVALRYDTPRLMAALREVRGLVRSNIDVLLCHGYKAGLVGWAAARWAGIPVLAISRGWTGESRKVQLYEQLDRRILCRMDRVICVSKAQADKVRAAGVRPERIRVIYNSIDVERFAQPVAKDRETLMAYFPPQFREGVQRVVGAAGRLSPEKGFDVLVAAAAQVIRSQPDMGFVIFGEGPKRTDLEHQIAAEGLTGRVVLAGFTDQLDALLPHCDVFVQSSYTEGLPNVLLEALAARTLVVATRVGGTAELLDAGSFGTLVEPGAPSALADAICHVLGGKELANCCREAGEAWVRERFTFARQAADYEQVFQELRSGVCK